MKKIKALSLLIAFLVAILFATNVYATDEDWTGISVSIEYSGKDHGTPSLKISNIPTDNIESGSEYWIFAFNQKNATLPTDTGSINYIGSIGKSDGTEKTYNYFNHFYSILETSGNVYITIEKNDGTIVVQDKELNRGNQLSLGNRIEGYFESNSTAIYLHEPHYTENSRKVKIKIGSVSDTSILNSLKDGESGALSKLLTYSKSASAIYSGSTTLGSSSAISELQKLTSNGYYFVYMELDDESGKYYSVEDVSLYQCIESSNGSKDLYDYLDYNFKWNIENGTDEEQKSADDTISPTKLPDAGYTSIIFAGIIIIALGIIFAVKNRKYRDIK